jgi:acyl-coenzyme A synthetase/AMP-(fatty) acid ligase
MNLSEPCPEFINITEYCLRAPTQNYGSKPALIFINGENPPKTWTYQDVWNEVTAIAHGIEQQNIAPSSRVFLQLPDSPDYIFAFFGAMLAGLVPIPSYEHLPQEEVAFLLQDSQSSLLITPDNIQNLKIPTKKSPSIKTKASDPAFLVYTSGTTDRPKGVLHGHRMIWGRRPIRQCLLDISAKDRLLHTDALNFTYTFGVQFMDVWASGATAILYVGEKKTPLWPKLIREFQVTIFASTPSTYNYMLKGCPEQLNFPSLRHCVSAGDALHSETIEKWEKLTSRPIYEALGMTEINLFISTDHLTPRKKGSFGKAQSCRKIAIFPLENGTTSIPTGQTGLLAIHNSDPGLMLGYWHRPKEEKESFREDWFLTGDLVHQDDEGYFFYHGRRGTILNIDADVVSPQEVETILLRCPGVQEVGCWAIEGTDKNLLLAAFVVPQKEHKLSEESVLSYAKKHLADYKCPKRVFILSALPRDPRGKLLRRKLPSLISSEYNRRAS